MAEDKKAVRQRKVNGWVISTIVLGVGFVVMSLVTMSFIVRDMHKNSGSNYAIVNRDRDTDYILENDLEITFEGDFLIQGSEESSRVDTGQLVVVKNKSNETLSFNIHVEATNEDGSERLDEDWLAVEKLAAGQSKTTRMFTFMTRSDAERLVGAKFRVIEVAEYE